MKVGNTFKWIVGAALVSGAFLCTQFATSVRGAEAAREGIGNYRIVGYQPDWETSNTPRFEKLTHLNYAFLQVYGDGTLKPIGNPERMKTMVAAAHRKGVKVLISVGGALNTTLTEAAVNAQSKLIASIENFAKNNGFDGIDLDWEGPQTPAQGAAYLKLVQKLSADLRPKGKLLTTAIATWFSDNIPTTAYAYLDFVNIMSYDDDCLTTNNFNHASYAKAESDLEYYLGRNVPKSKAVIGVPFYGYDAAGCPPKYIGTAYKDVIAKDANAANADRSNGVNYNGIATMRQKTELAKTSASGIMIWQLAQDTNDSSSLLSAIYDTFAGSATPPK
jgi:chitinase